MKHIKPTKNAAQVECAEKAVATVVDNLHKRGRLLPTQEVARILNCHIVSIYRFMRERDDFPVPIRISTNRLAWFEQDILDFIASRPLRKPRP